MNIEVAIKVDDSKIDRSYGVIVSELRRGASGRLYWHPVGGQWGYNDHVFETSRFLKLYKVLPGIRVRRDGKASLHFPYQESDLL